MMTEIVFATNNKGKLTEVQQLLSGSDIKILSLRDIGFEGDLPETQNSFEGNASQKANYLYDKYGYSCFADDSGLEVDALNNAPGVYSARYAGSRRNDEDNIDRVLRELRGVENRKARFRAVIALIHNGIERHFEGTVEGSISENTRGDKGFGYDPIFIPENENRTFAEMSTDEKNKISHRGKAMAELTEYLRRIR